MSGASRRGSRPGAQSRSALHMRCTLYSIFRAERRSSFPQLSFYDRSQYTEYVSSITSESGQSTAEGMAARPAEAAAGGGCRNQAAGGYTAAPVASSKLACAAKALNAADSLCTLSAGLRCSVTALSRVPAWG